jgi:large subunit ribosomal protein L32e
MVKIGYGSYKGTKHMLPSHFYKFRVSNVADVDLLLMHNTKYAAEIAHDVSAKKRKAIIERAAQLDIKVLNANARVRTEDSK